MRIKQEGLLRHKTVNNNNNFISFEHDMLSGTTIAVPLSIMVVYNLNRSKEGGHEAI